ncbi:glycosyltransferase [Paenibacillus rhizoplanae]|uniref:glycosyltransferase n=1 Tax=Paenibacillus rhizoplanae TaxID=1917181 RepID=UPI00361973AF
MHTIPPLAILSFLPLWPRLQIASDGVLSLPEQTAIGTGVMVREGYRWEISSPSKDGSPRILIGDRCECSRFLTIIASGKVELKADAITGPHVYINDARQDWEKGGNPSDTLIIGEGSWIGAHSSILGPVKIGKGCVVGAGSVVLRDVPDYCVVAGNPAEFRRIYEPSSGEWIRVDSEAEARRVLERRSREPLLSICIPGRNQAVELKRCLESIYAQMDDDGLIEVCVLDDASSEETAEVGHHYGQLHRSFRYHRDPDLAAGGSVVASQAADRGRGKFIMLHEPGDSFMPNTLLPFLNVLHTHPECAIILIQPTLIRSNPQTERLEGLSEFFRLTASSSSPPLPVVLNRKDWERTADSVQATNFLDPWVSRQHALLQLNPQFCLCRYTMTEAGRHIGSAP